MEEKPKPVSGRVLCGLPEPPAGQEAVFSAQAFRFSIRTIYFPVPGNRHPSIHPEQVTGVLLGGWAPAPRRLMEPRGHYLFADGCPPAAPGLLVGFKGGPPTGAGSDALARGIVDFPAYSVPDLSFMGGGGQLFHPRKDLNCAKSSGNFLQKQRQMGSDGGINRVWD